ncbi:hypothetical protein [Paenibacillus polymyxa]|uniref:hypothetical protein n=1 Tax=Paenibacillus polymyxa TaxID=1406 RepID=UPI00298C55B4|nr:hypothetical protein [Paenibacillus polymyxa]
MNFRCLRTNMDFFTAALSGSQVYVVSPLNEDVFEIVDYGGKVEKFTPKSVKIAGSYYFRSQFEFRVDVKKDSAGM